MNHQRPPFLVCLNKEQYDTCTGIVKAALNGAVNMDCQDPNKLNFLKCVTTFTETFHSLRSLENVLMKTVIKLMVIKELEKNNIPPTIMLDDIIQRDLKTAPFILPFKLFDTCITVLLTTSSGTPFEVESSDEWHAMSIFAALMETYIVETPHPSVFVNAVGLFAASMYRGFLWTYRTFLHWHLAYHLKKVTAPPGIVPLPPTLASLPSPTETEQTSFTIIESILVSALDQITDKTIPLPISCRVTPAIAEATVDSLNIDAEKIKEIMDDAAKPKVDPQVLLLASAMGPSSTEPFSASISPASNPFMSPVFSPPTPSPTAFLNPMYGNPATIPPAMIDALLSGPPTSPKPKKPFYLPSGKRRIKKGTN